MAITRREFLQYSAATGAGVFLGVFDLKPIVAYAQANPPVWTSEAFNICPYCGVGCGMVVGKNVSGQITYVQGDPDNPHNKGALCSKGMNAGQLTNIAVLGTAKATNEECYLLTKLVRSLGIVYLEHCARL